MPARRRGFESRQGRYRCRIPGQITPSAVRRGIVGNSGVGFRLEEVLPAFDGEHDLDVNPVVSGPCPDEAAPGGAWKSFSSRVSTTMSSLTGLEEVHWQRHYLTSAQPATRIRTKEGPEYPSPLPFSPVIKTASPAKPHRKTESWPDRILYQLQLKNVPNNDPCSIARTQVPRRRGWQGWRMLPLARARRREHLARRNGDTSTLGR